MHCEFIMNKRKNEKTVPRKIANNIFSTFRFQQPKSSKKQDLVQSSPTSAMKAEQKSSKRVELTRSDSGLSSDSSDPGQQARCSSSLCQELQPDRGGCRSNNNNHDHSDDCQTMQQHPSLNNNNKYRKCISPIPSGLIEMNCSQNKEALSAMDSSSSSSVKNLYRQQENFELDCVDCLGCSPAESESETSRIRFGDPVNYETKSFDDEDDSQESSCCHNEESLEYQSKIADLKRQIELISRKVLYMEEHIIDLNNENNSLKKQLANIEDLYKRKIQIREDEIESLKETLLELETNNTELRCKEQELQMEKRILLEDVKLLKQQLASQDSELIYLKNSCEKLSELEKSYKNVTEQLETLKISNLKALNELEENYKMKFAQKNLEIEALQAKIEELSCQRCQCKFSVKRKDSPESSQPIKIFGHQATNTNSTNNNKTITAESTDHPPQSSTLTPKPSIQSLDTSLNYPEKVKEGEREEEKAPTPSVTTKSQSSSSFLVDSNDHSISDQLNDSSVPSDQGQQQSLALTNIQEENSVITQQPIKIMAETATMNRSKRMLKRVMSYDYGDECNSFKSNTFNEFCPTPINSSVDCDDQITESVDDNNNNCTTPTSVTPKPETTTVNVENNQKPEVFPSLPDVMLRKLCLLRENTCSIESLSEQEIDAKFHTLALAFKTDKFTLEQRIKLYRHQRDVAENDANTELRNLSEYVQELYRLLLGSDSKFFYNNNLSFNQLKELKEMLDKINLQTQVIKAAVMRISSRAELYGSVKQEEKLNTAFDVILMHTENLKRAKERDAKELEDLKRLLQCTGLKNNNQNESDTSDTFDLSNMFNASCNRRSSAKSKESLKINPLLMSNHLQNIQVNYQQTSRGCGLSKEMKRTRRLSVPAAEIRNRPKLLQLLSEKKFSDDSEKQGQDDKNFHNRTTRSETPRPVIKIDENDENSEHEQNDRDCNFGDELSHANFNKKLSITPIDIKEQVELLNGHCNNFEDDEQTNMEDLVEKQNIKDNNKIKAKRFYKELVQRLAPFEDKTWKQKMNDKFSKFFQAICVILTMISDESRSRFYWIKHSNISCEIVRYFMSGTFILMSIVILIWSILLPMFYK